METKTNNKKALSIAIIALAVLLAIAGSIYFFTKQKGVAGTKQITIELSHGENTETKTIKIKTDKESLLDAMIEKGLILEEDYKQGQMITKIDGKTADSDKHEFWSLTQNGEMLNTGFADTMIADGEKYEVTLATW